MSLPELIRIISILRQQVIRFC